MRVLRKIAKWVLMLVVVAIAGVAGWLYFVPPDLIRVGGAYAAKIVCSNVFVAGRDAEEVLSDDVQAPGHPLLKLMRIEVDESAKTVTAALLGRFGTGAAAYRDGLGCASVPDGDIEVARAVSLPAAAPAERPNALWPQGDRVEPSKDPVLAKILDDPALAGPNWRAIVVVHNGRIVGERYAEGFSPETPLLGWSMTKTVNAAIVGTLVKAGKMRLDAADLLDIWKGDERSKITLTDLMAMSSGLAFNEDYGTVADVTRMLFLEPDMAGFAASRPLVGGVGQAWSYSSGTAVLLSRLWQDAAGADALAWPHRALFEPLGMASAVLEADEKGTFVGSSYLYATARDWTRFGQFLLQDGTWNGQELLPAGFVKWMRKPAPASDGVYGRGQLWLQGPGGTGDDTVLPPDTYWLIGHDGQSMAIVPSKHVAVLRLGLTPSKHRYRPQKLLAAVIDTLD